MRQKLGETRSAMRGNHAVISPDSHEQIALPRWPGSLLTFLVTPQTGASFSMFFAIMEQGSVTEEPIEGVERFILVMDGAAVLVAGARTCRLGVESFAFVPADAPHTIQATEPARLLVLERRYLPIGRSSPELVIGHTAKRSSINLKGDTDIKVQKLLPERPEFDCEINIMEFAPGASLPYVETHFMEHGLLMLSGGGIYRLDESWYPVAQGDAIWMGAFCPQWFGALGRHRSRYLIYKNWNRDPLAL